MDLELNKIYCCNALDLMARMPDGFIDLTVTSPPYYGLRDYNSEPQIWGGSADCSHDWAERIAPAANGLVNNPMQGETLSGHSATRRARKSSFCNECGAWKGCLGLEPTPQQFIANLVTIFAEVKRVLRPDGVLILNLGDSYNQGNKGNSGQVQAGSKQGTNFGSLATRRGEGLSPHRNGGANGLCKPKDLMGIPWRVAFALQESGWWLRSDIPWVKRSAMPDPTSDRPAKALEYLFLLTKSPKYYFDLESIRQRDRLTAPKLAAVSNGKGRDRSLPQNRNGITGSLDRTPAGERTFRNSDLWLSSIAPPHGLIGIGDEIVGIDVTPNGFSGAHFATFPEKLIAPFITAGSRVGGIVYDPFMGAGTTGLVAHKLGRKWVGSELNPGYVELANKRLEPYLMQEQLF